MRRILVATAFLFVFQLTYARMLTMEDLREFAYDVSEDAQVEFTTQLLLAYREMFLAIHIDRASPDEALYECAMSQDINLIATVIVWEANNKKSAVVLPKTLFDPKEPVAYRYLRTLQGKCVDE